MDTSLPIVGVNGHNDAVYSRFLDSIDYDTNTIIREIMSIDEKFVRFIGGVANNEKNGDAVYASALTLKLLEQNGENSFTPTVKDTAYDKIVDEARSRKPYLNNLEKMIRKTNSGIVHYTTRLIEDMGSIAEPMKKGSYFAYRVLEISKNEESKSQGLTREEQGEIFSGKYGPEDHDEVFGIEESKGIQSLKEELEKAIDNENYERCAELRDEIEKLES